MARRSAWLPLLCVLLLAPASCGLPRWPVEGTMTSPFGLRLRGLLPDLHPGVDVAVPEGTPVLAMRGGRVRFAGPMRGYGRVVILEHAGGWTSLYAHLAELRVETGQAVRGRQEIGLAGRTGNATGSHLHFEVRHRGRAQDPVPLLGRAPGG